MLDIIKTLSQTSLPAILSVAGVLFIFMAIGGKFGAQIITDNISKPIAATIGSVLLVISSTLFVISSTIQPNNKKSTEITIENPETNNKTPVKSYKLRPTLPINKPISQTTDIELSLSKDDSTNCSAVIHQELVFTILGRDENNDPTVAKRKEVSNTTTLSCRAAGEENQKITTTHGELEGIELLAHRTQEGLWVFDTPPGTSEIQIKAMKNQGFIEPFSGLPKEKVPIGKVITVKDENLSLVVGTAIPGKKEGTVAIKLERVTNEREPTLQLSYSFNVRITMLDNKVVEMDLNGGGSCPASENSKLNGITILHGVVIISTPDNPNTKITAPATVKITVNEL